MNTRFLSAILALTILPLQAFAEVLTLPEALTEIGEQAFQGDLSITEVILPEGLESVAASAFDGCTELAQVDWGRSISEYGSLRIEEGNAPLQDASWRFGDGWQVTVSGTELTLEGTAETLPAFTETPAPWDRHGAALTVVSLPAGLKQIGDNALASCTGLRRVRFGGTMAEWQTVEIGAGHELLDSCVIVCSDGTLNDIEWSMDQAGCLTVTGQGAMRALRSPEDAPWHQRRNEITSVIIGEGVTSVSSYAFCDCPGLMTVTLPGSMEEIGANAFTNCTALTLVRYHGPASARAEIRIADETLNAAAWDYISDMLWTISGDGCLNISGGFVPDYAAGGAPWNSQAYAITSVEVAEGVTYVGSYAFDGLLSATAIALPESLASISETALPQGTAAQLRLPSGHWMVDYALEKGIDFRTPATRYRALLICECRYLADAADPTNTSGYLESTLVDGQTMRSILTSYPGTPWQVTMLEDMKYSQIRLAIANTFAGSTKEDVNLFFFSGHGVSGGIMVDIEKRGITPALLKGWLDAVPGRKIVAADCCYSGGLIGKDGVVTGMTDEDGLVEVILSNDYADFNDDFIGAFSGGGLESRSGELAVAPYYVMTACGQEYKSYSDSADDGGFGGVFTYSLGLGCGWDAMNKVPCFRLANNGGSVMSFHEAYTYARGKASALAAAHHLTQDAKVWPENCVAFGWLRDQ